jgi:hypothetical protein
MVAFFLKAARQDINIQGSHGCPNANNKKGRAAGSLCRHGVDLLEVRSPASRGVLECCLMRCCCCCLDTFGGTAGILGVYSKRGLCYPKRM